MQRLVELVDGAQRIVAFTGAGVSTASNIPDFRGPRGVYKTSSPVYYQDFVASEAARIDYWKFKLSGYRMFQEAKPNLAHYRLVDLQRLGKLAALVTQNVDGLHQLAGTARDKLIELHGSNSEVECDDCAVRETPQRCMGEFAETGLPPRCSVCGGLMKPAVVMFGQSLDMQLLARAFRAAESADLIIALGSSLVVTPAADVPLAGARKGVPYVIVNEGQTPHDQLATLRLDGDVGHCLDQLVAQLGKPAAHPV
jgi:NAD-dependent deacetylase